MAVVLAGLAASSAAAADSSQLRIQVLSNRADLVSGRNALVAVDLPAGVSPSTVKMRLGPRNVTSAFAQRPNGRFEGLVTGLADGPNVLTALTRGGQSAQITLVNHPIGGPVFSGPQVKPWQCQDGAQDEQCNAPTTYEYQYKSSVTGQLSSYDPDNPPGDVATTTTDQGQTVPFIIRTETGYQDRDQYKIAVLYDPKKPWAAWDPQKQWNHKLLIPHGASCGIDHQSGEAPSVTGDTLASSSPTEALGRGFAVLS